jgi:hypothetical protein
LLLAGVLERLGALGIETELMAPEAADAADLLVWDMLLPMCESYPRLLRLKALAEGGELIVNPPEAVLRCYRTRMVEAFARTAGLRFPETETRGVVSPGPLAPPAFDAGGGFWVKRGDVHNTCAGDVVFARGPAEAEAVRRDFERREIAALILQRPVEGDLVKFYGVGPGEWFTWFYHEPRAPRRPDFKEAGLRAQAELAAGAAGLSIFGGDAIIPSEGEPWVIDVNSWPSFARVRAEACARIAHNLQARLAAAGRRSAP